MSMEEESKKATEYWSRWTWNSKLQKMIYIPAIPEYYRNEITEDDEPSKAYTYFVRAVYFAAIPLIIALLVPVIIYGLVRLISKDVHTFGDLIRDEY